jgi:hypothetical protein
MATPVLAVIVPLAVIVVGLVLRVMPWVMADEIEPDKGLSRSRVILAMSTG